MSHQSAYQTIEPDEPSLPVSGSIGTPVGQASRPPVVLTPTNSAPTATSTPGAVESGLGSILRQSSHPLALFCLYFFRISAISVYVLCGFLTDNYVLSTVVVVVLLAMDFWNCRNVAGRTLVGLRFWNQVDEDGESYWVFESRDPSQPANPIDSRMFWIALYTFPVLWTLLLIVSIFKFNISFLPIVGLAIVFNVTNVIGFTYADRDSKQKWASQMAAGGWNTGLGGLGGQVIGSVVSNGIGRLLR